MPHLFRFIKKNFKKIMKNFIKTLFAVIFLLALSCKTALACACGCGVFSVGTSALIPNCQGGTAFLQYDHLTQNRNWSKEKKSDEHNHDTRIATQTVTAGVQYMFNRSWGLAARIPYVTRLNSQIHEETIEEEDDHGHHHEISKTTSEKIRTNSVGDIRVNAIYSGFSDDMSSGITFGLKLPTAQDNARNVERNMQIGTGSTDFLIGGYKLGKFSNNSKLNWFAQTNWQHAFLVHRGYRVGDEISAASGIFYDAGKFYGIKKVAPILQITAAKRLKDKGWASDQQNSGYSQAFFAPALEVNFNKFKIYADVEFPIYRNVNGNQLVAQNIYKMILGYNF